MYSWDTHLQHVGHESVLGGVVVYPGTTHAHQPEVRGATGRHDGRLGRAARGGEGGGRTRRDVRDEEGREEKGGRKGGEGRDGQNRAIRSLGGIHTLESDTLWSGLRARCTYVLRSLEVAPSVRRRSMLATNPPRTSGRGRRRQPTFTTRDRGGESASDRDLEVGGGSIVCSILLSDCLELHSLEPL